MGKIILFDGECNFCNSSIQFIIKRDPKGTFKFASLQSDIGRELLGKFDVSKNIDSIVLIENDKVYFKSSAALSIAKNLIGFWKLFYLFVVIPKPLRDFFYDIVAKNRYKWFGKRDTCMLPSPELKKRFL